MNKLTKRFLSQLIVCALLVSNLPSGKAEESLLYPNAVYAVTANELDDSGKWMYRELSPDVGCEDASLFYDKGFNPNTVTGRDENGNTKQTYVLNSASEKISGNGSVHRIMKQYGAIGFVVENLDIYSEGTEAEYIMTYAAKTDAPAGYTASFNPAYVVYENEGTRKEVSFTYPNTSVTKNIGNTWTYYSQKLRIAGSSAAKSIDKTKEMAVFLSRNDKTVPTYDNDGVTSVTDIFIDEWSFRRIPQGLNDNFPMAYTKSISVNTATGKTTPCNGDTVTFTYSLDIDPRSVRPEKIAVNGVFGSGIIKNVSVEQISSENRDTTVTLTLDNMTPGCKYTISLENIKDAWGRDVVGAACIDFKSENKSTGSESVYLTDDNFRHIETDALSPVSSWDFDKSGGEVIYTTYDGVRLNDKSTLAPMKMSKKLSRRNSGIVTMETAFTLLSRKEGFCAGLSDGEETVAEIRSGIKSLYLYTNDGTVTSLCDYNMTDLVYDRIGIVMELDLDSNRVSVRVNGGSETISTIKSAGIDGIYFKTSDTVEIQTYIHFAKVYANYSVNQRFMASGTEGSMPTQWGNAQDGKIVVTDNSMKPDVYSLSVNSGKEVAFSFLPLTTVRKSYAFSFLAPQGNAQIAFLSEQNEGYSFLYNAGILSLNGEELAELSCGVWHDVVVREYGALADIYINGKKRKTVLCDSVSINKFKAAAENSPLEIDDILAFTYSEQDVPATNKVTSESYDVGIMRCDIWREGYHSGWDNILPYEKNHPLLGFYDDGNEAVANWEIKWMAEHGISWQLHCWFLPTPYNGGPIKTPHSSAALENGYFFAENSEEVDFAIMWENAACTEITADIFKNDIVPYWVEHYLKDERYYKIDGKPVISIYSPKVFLEGIRSGCESDEEALTAAQECLSYLREACVNSGYPGAFILGRSSALEELSLEKSIGFDAVHAYTWSDISNDPVTQQGYLKRAAENTKESGIGLIPVASVGLDETPWGRAPGQMMSSENFKEVLSYIAADAVDYYKNNGKATVLLDNWNEFGEGHYIMPAGYCGFEFLDAVREVFAGGGSHSDEAPDAQMKKKLGTLYPQNRKPKPIEKITVPVGSEVIKRWTGQEIFETWSKNSHVSEVSCANGIYKAVSIGDDPAILSQNNLQIDLTDVNYIRIKVKRTATDSRIHVFYRHSQDEAFSEGFSTYVNAGKSGKWEELYFPVWQNEGFSGTLYQLRVDCINSQGEFEVESIELLRGAASDRPDWVIDSNKVNPAVPLQTYGGAVYADMKDIAQCFGANVTYLSEADEVIFVTDTDILSYHADGQMYRNGQLSGNGGALRGIAGSYMLPLSGAAELFLHDFVWNEETAAVTMTEKLFFPEISYNISYDLDPEGKWEYRNLVPESECEKISEFWEGNENTAGISESIKHSGEGSVYKDYTARYQRLGFLVPLEPYTQYHFSGWMKNDNTTDTAKIMSFGGRYSVWDSNGNLKTLASGCEYLLQPPESYFALNSQWNYVNANVSVKQCTHEDGKSYFLSETDFIGNGYFYLTQTENVNQRVYMDDIGLRKIPYFRVYTKNITGADNGSFKLDEAIEFNFSHDIDVWSVTADKILINGTAANEDMLTVAIDTDEQTRETTVSVKLLQAAAGENYTISLEHIKDAWGRDIIGGTSVSLDAAPADITAVFSDSDGNVINTLKKGKVNCNVKVNEELFAADETVNTYIAVKNENGQCIFTKLYPISINQMEITAEGISVNVSDSIEIYVWNDGLVPVAGKRIFDKSGLRH